MHVNTMTLLTVDEVHARFASAGTTESSVQSRKLSYTVGRNPPKLFLSGAPVTLPAAAEVAVNRRPSGTEVVLRLMWGPLPAPFPRALAAAGILAGLLIAFFSDGASLGWIAASLITLLPLAALFYQKRGEQQIQSRLSKLLGSTGFSPKPH